MTSDGSIHPGKLGRLVAAAVILVGLVVGAVLLASPARKPAPAGGPPGGPVETPGSAERDASLLPRPAGPASAPTQGPGTGASAPAGAADADPVARYRDSGASEGTSPRRRRSREGELDSAPRIEREPVAGFPTAAPAPFVSAGAGAGASPSAGPARARSVRPGFLPEGVTGGHSGPPAPPSGSTAEESVSAEANANEDPTPTSDRTPPVLESLRFDPPELADGGTTVLSIQVSDNLSGVKTVSGNVRSPSGAATLFFHADGPAGGNMFVARIGIPAKAETGLWYLGSLFVLDQADNLMVGSFTPPTVPAGGTLRVVSAESDSTPPEVQRVFVEKGTVSGGERNLVRIDIQDEPSGVASITGAFQSSSKAALLPFVCHASADPAVWEGEVSIPTSAECGTWTMHHLRAVDRAGNIAYLTSETPQFAAAAFVVSSASCDSSPPTLESFVMSPTVVSNASATEISVSAIVRDEGSGVASMLGWISGPASTNGQIPKIFFNCAHAQNDPDGLWTGKILVPQHAANGIWSVGLARVQDRALNARDYTPNDPVLSQSTFQVQ